MRHHRILHGLHNGGTDIGVAEFVLGLRLEHRLLHLDRQNTDDAVTYIRAIELLPVNSLMPFSMPSRKADRWVPPSLV